MIYTATTMITISSLTTINQSAHYYPTQAVFELYLLLEIGATIVHHQDYNDYFDRLVHDRQSQCWCRFIEVHKFHASHFGKKASHLHPMNYVYKIIYCDSYFTQHHKQIHFSCMSNMKWILSVILRFMSQFNFVIDLLRYISVVIKLFQYQTL